MIKAGVMTFLHNNNYGSTLQAWALQQVLAELDVEAEHIDYRPSVAEKIKNLLLSGNNPRLILEGLKKRAVLAGNAGAREKSAAFSVFRDARMKLSPVCRNKADLKRIAGRYDLLICGSDQIWSPVWLNPAYFLDFAGSRPRVAYAASTGVSVLGSRRKARRITRLVRPFRAVSMREEEGAALIRNLTGRSDLPVLPDPVCLPERNTWIDLAASSGLSARKDPYLVCYLIGDRPDYWAKIRALREERGLTVVVVPVTESAFHQGFDTADGLSPEAFLSLLSGAALVCTDSFHCTVFSVILHRPFLCFRRYAENDPESKNSRIDQFMRHMGLHEDTSYPDPEVWERTDKKLAMLRTAGLSWLSGNLSN